MKRKILPIPILGCLLCAFVVMAQDSFYAYYRDGSIEKFSTNNVDSISLVRPHGTVTDVCGNTYNFLLIGDLLWFTENMRCNKYNNGTEMMSTCGEEPYCYAFGQCGVNTPKTKVSDDYILKAGYYYAYNIARFDVICPDGWRVPTVDDFKNLFNYAKNEDNVKGLRSKEGWLNYSGKDTPGTDDLGFCALPIGFGYRSTPYSSIGGSSAFFWTSTKYNPDSDYVADIYYAEITGQDHTNAKNANAQLTWMAPIRCCRDKMPVDGN